MANSRANFWQNFTEPVPFDIAKFVHILTAPEFAEAEAKQWVNDRFPLTLQVLRKRPLLFLHWYHHIVTMLYAFYSYPIMPAFNRWGIYLNFITHSYMYSNIESRENPDFVYLSFIILFINFFLHAYVFGGGKANIATVSSSCRSRWWSEMNADVEAVQGAPRNGMNNNYNRRSAKSWRLIILLIIDHFVWTNFEPI
ncbi:hypothetical protein GPALN_003049 [Globodera pallida]|nr:hypothetical protein GPALN_003049 [Globodera pallida]